MNHLNHREQGPFKVFMRCSICVLFVACGEQSGDSGALSMLKVKSMKLGHGWGRDTHQERENQQRHYIGVHTRRRWGRIKTRYPLGFTLCLLTPEATASRLVPLVLDEDTS